MGLKPSYGLVSARGVVPLSLRLDHVGPLTRTVADAAHHARGMAGYDPNGPMRALIRAEEGAQSTASSQEGIQPWCPHQFTSRQIEPAVWSAFQGPRPFRAVGCRRPRVSLPSYDVVRGRRAVFVRVEVEAAAVQGALYRSEPERFSPEMRGYLDWGLRASAVRLAGADRVIDVAAHELRCALASVDAVLTPTTPQAAFAFAGKVPDNVGDFCVLANMAGCPAISLAMGANELGLPLGLQVIAAKGQEDRLLAIARVYEDAAGMSSPPPARFAPR